MLETSAESESMACMTIETQRNLGYPDGSSSNGEVLVDKCKSEGTEKAVRKSDGS